ncbi:MAG: sugar transferase [bacterium]
MIYRNAKRLLDIIIAGVFLLLFSPFGLIIIIILKFTGEGELFFKQKRLGYKNRPIFLWKFATMLKESPKTGTLTAKNDPRILLFGKFLRKTKINEIPQLINVLKGDMSIVGPRPLVQETFNHYPEEMKPFIYDKCKPGLTGIGSVVFCNEEEILARSAKELFKCYKEDIMPIKGECEIWYRNNQGFFLDLKVIILTAWIILFSKSSLPEILFPDLFGKIEAGMSGRRR